MFAWGMIQEIIDGILYAGTFMDLLGKGQVGRSGVVHDPQQHQQVLRDVLTAAQTCGLSVRAAMASPLLSPKGNREFLAHLRLDDPPMPAQTLQELCIR